MLRHVAEPGCALRVAMYVSCSVLYRMCRSVAGGFATKTAEQIVVGVMSTSGYTCILSMRSVSLGLVSFRFAVCAAYVCAIAAAHQTCMTLVGFWVDAPEVVSSCGSTVCRFELYIRNCREDRDLDHLVYCALTTVLLQLLALG